MPRSIETRLAKMEKHRAGPPASCSRPKRGTTETSIWSA